MSKSAEPPGAALPGSTRPPKGELTEVDGWKSAAQTQRLLHELRIHQIELEMQNEELRASRSEVEAGLKRYTDLYDFAPVGYLTLSAEGLIQELNLPAAALLGHERSRLTGARLRAFVAPDTRLVFDAWLSRVFLDQEKQGCEVAMLREGQPRICVQLEATRALDGQSGRAVVTDITARKALEEELRQAQKLEVIAKLAGGVAHDFNNILAAMILNLGLLREEDESPDQAALETLDALAQRASSLTNQLLLFSRRQAMQPVLVELNAALTRFFEMLARLLGESISCRFQPAARELWVEADVALLEQAVMNLCLNARDAMPSGGVLSLATSVVDFDAASVRSELKARPGTFVCLQVSDTGCGMTAEALEHVFEPFFTTKEVGSGTGLGLASVHGTIQQHLGWLNVESRLGHGTTFRVYLPESLKPKPIPKAAPRPGDARGKGETILLVEDEPTLLAVAGRALTRLGYRVLSATDGRHALTLWQEHGGMVDLLLTDMRMPKGMNGLALAEKLAAAKPSLKIIIMSGYSAEMATNGAADRVEFSYLAKPFELEALAITVRNRLDEPPPGTT